MGMGGARSGTSNSRLSVVANQGIDVWHMLFGGSWGSFLALAYACYEPARVTSMVLRGIFLGSATEIRWLYEDGGASELFPDAWERYDLV